METNKKKNNNLIFIILIGAIIIVLLYYFLFSKKQEIVFKFKDNDIKLKIGDTRKINYELSDPNLQIEWLSSNNDITVNNGEIKATKYGTGIISGIVKYDDKTITNTCNVTVYTGEENVLLDNIDVPDGYLLMKPDSEYELPFTLSPANAYVTGVEFTVTDPTIVDVRDNKIISIYTGTVTVTYTVNNISKTLMVIVSDKANDNMFVKDVESVSLNESDITMEIGDTKKLSYEIKPQNGYVENVEWISTNKEIVSVNDGTIEAVGIGDASVKVRINDKFESVVNIKVKASNADIKIDYNPKLLLRIGEKTTIKSHLEPNGINDKIVYKSSNNGVASVDNGIITGVGEGSATITMTISNGKSKSFSINVLPKKGFISGSGNLWGYQSLNAKVPTRANISFFQKIAQSGVGVVQGNNYVITISGVTYTYDVNSSILNVNNKSILVRFYYPPNVDLSTVNTLVYMGGRGETNFGGAFVDIDKDPSMIKSGGIVALIAEGKTFNGEGAAQVTKFIKAITKQKDGVKNSLLGFSDGAHQVLDGAKFGNYDRLVIFSGYVDYASSVENAKDKEIIFIIAANDGNYRGVRTAINQMKNSGYKNVTAVTNATDLGVYENSFLLHINPGKLMKFGHLTENIFNSKIIEYLND